MSKPNVPEFWKLLGESGLVTPEQIAHLQQQYGQMRGAALSNSLVLAEWLASEKVITPFQRDVLLKGRCGPFHYGDFQVNERIEKGRFHGHYRAVHRETGHPVMLVFFSGPGVADAQCWSRVLDTAKRSFLVRSPHATRCFELIDLGPYKFAVVEELQGTSVAQVLAGGTPLPVGDASSIVRQIALGLAAVNEQGIVHGEIRPGTFWLSERGRAELLCFPISRDELTPHKPLDHKTVEYAAPELNQLTPVPTTATDIYALGCTFYQMLTGRTPFASPPNAPEAVPRKMARHASEPIVGLHELGVAPEALNQVISYMMAKNVDVRYSSATQVAEALAPFVPTAQRSIAPQPSETLAAYEAVAEARRNAAMTAPAPTKPVEQPAISQPKETSPPPQPPTVESSPAPAPQSESPPAPGGQSTPAPVTQPTSAAEPTGTPAASSPTTGGVLTGAPAAATVAAATSATVAVATATAAVPDNGQAVAALQAPKIDTPSLEELGRIGQPATEAASGTDATADVAGKRRLKRSTRNNLMALAATALLALLIVGGIYYFGADDTSTGDAVASSGPTEDVPATKDEGAASEDTSTDGGTEAIPSGDSAADIAAKDAYEDLIPDDGSTLWASPTYGDQLDLKFLAPGAQVLFVLRPRDLLAAPRGREILQAMGPAGSSLEQWITAETGLPLTDIERLDIALHEPPSGAPLVSLVVRAREPFEHDQLRGRWQTTREAQHSGITYYVKGSRCYYFPGESNTIFTIAGENEIKEAIDWLDDPARITDGMDALRQWSDRNRHVSILFSNNYIRSARSTLYPGSLAPLHDAISWFLGTIEGVPAGLLSFHAGEEFFAELRLFVERDKLPQVVAREFHEQLGRIPQQLTEHYLELSTLGRTISAYSKPVLGKLPSVVRLLHANTRYDRNKPKGQQAVLRCYLPPVAANYLAMGTDLVLLETAGTTTSVGTTVAAKPKTLREKLKQPTSLAFDRDTLVASVQSLSEDIGIKIEVLGGDLEMDGITKNQSFGLEMRNQPAEDILLKIVMLANPDKTVKKPSEPGQKLIYVIKEKYQGGDDAILITTRAAAAERGDVLPVPFREG